MHFEQPNACAISAETETIYTIVVPRLNIARMNRQATQRTVRLTFLAIMDPQNGYADCSTESFGRRNLLAIKITVGFCERR
jgi:hypothetical protein